MPAKRLIVRSTIRASSTRIIDLSAVQQHGYCEKLNARVAAPINDSRAHLIKGLLITCRERRRPTAAPVIKNLAKSWAPRQVEVVFSGGANGEAHATRRHAVLGRFADRRSVGSGDRARSDQRLRC